MFNKKRFSVGRIGALLGDISNGGGGAGIRQYDQYAQAQAQEEERKRLEQERAARMNEWANQAGFSPEQRYAAAVNPEAFGKSLSTNYEAANVSGGDSRYVNGQMMTAPKLSNNGNQFFTQGANGTQQTGDFGMTYDEGITSQNNLATQGLRGQELNEDVRSNQANEALTGFSNQTGRMNANTSRYEAINPNAGPMSVSEQIALSKYQDEQEVAAQAETAANIKKGQTLGNISRLKEGGELSDAFRTLYGKSRFIPGSNIPGSSRADARAVIDQITSDLTIESLSAFKGAISEKEMATAAAAATRLQNPISDAEAIKALNEVEQVLAKVESSGGLVQSGGGQEYQEGDVAENDRGDKLVYRNGQWVRM
ncbi:hypothetical protein [Litorimonas sp.]|uniref:hypothetical protein n=1 Tax=Litorimonas sp. TaxID=1892381 RepID=UPI003A86D780